MAISLNDLRKFKKPPSASRSLRPWHDLPDEFKDNNEPSPVTESDKPSEAAAKLEPTQSQTEGKVEPELAPKCDQTDTKAVPKYEQSGTKAVSKVAPKCHQTDTKVVPKHEETTASYPQTSTKVVPQPVPKPVPKCDQTDTKVVPKCDLSALVGLQRRVLIFIYEMCRLSGEKISPPISILNLAEATETTAGAAKIAARRLEEKRFIERESFKDGRGGWTRYRILDDAYNALLHNESSTKVASKWYQTNNKVVPQPVPEPVPNALSSSSNLYISKETTTTDAIDSLYNEIDISPLAQIGFTKEHLKQIASQRKLTPPEVQRSIKAFAFDLEKNDIAAKKIKGSPLNFFMGILKRDGLPYSPPENYVDEEQALLNRTLELLEKARREKEEKKARIDDLLFEEYYEGLSATQQREILGDMMRLDSPGAKPTIREYWQKNVRPKIDLQNFGST